MEFSVLMSVYKNDNPIFFEKAIDSITKKQTLKPTQVIIVKDGPVGDEINKIIDYKKNENSEINFTIIEKENNEGLAAALNAGIKECKTEWIARMDSDDISVEDRFEKQINFILKNNNVDVIGGAISEFNTNIGDMHSIRIVGLDNVSIKKMAKKRTPMNHVSVMYRKSAVIAVGGYSESFGKLEDYKLWIDLISSHYNLVNLSDILVYVRVGNGFIARRSDKREIQDWDVLQRYLLKNHLINIFEALQNKLYIRIFIYMPNWLKKLAYKLIFRRKKNEKI